MTSQTRKLTDIDYLPRLKVKDEQARHESEKNRELVAVAIGVLGGLVTMGFMFNAFLYGLEPMDEETQASIQFNADCALVSAYVTSMIITFGVFTKDMRKRAWKALKNKF